jgi:hypothetical protein
MSTVAGLYRQHSGAARRPGHGASASIGSRDSIKPASSTTSPSAGGFSNSNPFYDHSWEPDAAARAGAPVTDRAAAKADADQRRREREERQALERREAEIERRERDLKRKQEMAEVETRRKREAEDEAARRKRAKEAKKLRKYEPRRPKFDFEKEKPKVMTAVASATQAATNLVNSCRHINRETENITESPRVQENLDKAKAARRVIVRYIQLVGDEEYLGTLLDANEKIVEAIKLYDKLSKPAALDSDSEPEDPRARSDAEQVGRIRARLAAQHLEDQRTGELQQLQVQQKAESQRQAARRAAKAPVTDATSTQPNLLYDDLKDLDFGSILSNPRAARLQAPMRPDSDSGSYDGGSLSDFSDYDSSEDEYRAAHAAHVKSHSRKSSRSYDYAGSSRHPDTSTYAALEDEQAGAGLMDPNDTFGDPFADENETLGQSRRRLEHVEI